MSVPAAVADIVAVVHAATDAEVVKFSPPLTAMVRGGDAIEFESECQWHSDGILWHPQCVPRNGRTGVLGSTDSELRLARLRVNVAAR